MEPDVIRMYSSSPPPMEDAAEEEDDEFSDFTGVPNSVSFTEFDTPVVFDQSQALTATSPPELLNNGRVVGLSDRGRAGPAKANGVVSGGCQEIGHTVRTVSAEELKRLAEHARTTPHTNSLDPVEGSRTEANAIGFDNGVAGSEVLTNGFADSDTKGTPPLSHKNGDPDLASSEEACPVPCHDDDDDFADFSAFSHTDAPGHSDQHTVESDDREKERQEENVDREDDSSQAHNEGGSVSNAEGEVDIRGACDAGLNLPPFPVETSGGLVNGEWGLHTRAACGQRDHDTDTAHQDSTNATEPACAEQPVTLNGNVAENGVEKGAGDSGDNRASPVLEIEKEAEQPDEKGSSGNETETETETSFGRPLSTDALEEFGDFSTTGSVPSPPLQEEMATPADHSQLAEDDDEDFGDFGDFGDAGSFSANAFADFDQQGAAVQTGSLESESKPPKETSEIGEEEFGDFDASGECRRGTEDDEVANFASFPGSDSFADFHSAPVDQGADDAEDGWQAFSEQEQSQGGSESWAAFDQDPGGAAVSESNEDERHQSQPYSAPPADSDENSRNDSTTAVLVSRLEKLFLVSFPEAPVPEVGEEVAPLKAFLEPADKSQSEEADRTPANGAVQNVWQQLLDIHNAFGLRHQWGGSHNNKTLLCSLGIDTRNILFTGQKKQPVIVPMYAASLGMLEPTKEPVKPVSAAEMIASIAQAPPVATEMPSCPPDAAQESLPPVQFDWSSSGLTNPLDASGGSSLLNLDFFGPVDESTSSTATSIPGVDPELYELTTAKLDPGGGGSRVADAFARLMSTVEKTSTSTRKPRKQENLSEEAQRVIAGLPDLSFMQAKVLMFPTSLTPLDSSTSSSPMPD